jgi:hypothetical protein
MKSFPAVVDYSVSEYLSTHSFVAFRSTCSVHYHDQEAWLRRAKSLPVNVSSLSMREKLALHHLLQWALQFEEQIGSDVWYQRIVEWLEHNSSIRIMHSFFANQKIVNIDFTNLTTRRKFLWQRSHYRGLYKRKRFSIDEGGLKRSKIQSH